MSKGKIVVAMSGGVDSSVAAVMLKSQGYDVVGITMKLYNSDSGCCSRKDIQDARRVAIQYDFEHHVINYEDKFKGSVIDYFTDSYLQGYTPLPCVKCNQELKFQDLLKLAKDMDAQAIATGHYAIIKDGAIYQAKDTSKDQSYFLFTLKKDDLSFVDFPLGRFTKLEIRKMAQDMQLKIHDKKESQDICFVQGTTYKEFIKKRVKITSGDIVDKLGNIVGKHDGIINYTIGQSKGLNIGGSKNKNYVIEIIPDKNIVVVGEARDLERFYVLIKLTNWLEQPSAYLKKEVLLRFRSTIASTVPATIVHIRDDKTLLHLPTPDYTGIAPGQAGVIYDDTGKIIAGGWIEPKLITEQYLSKL